MNFWVKSKGLLTLLLLIILSSSCEDEENTIGLPLENQLDLNYFEYIVPTEMVWVDSVRSDVEKIQAGRYNFFEGGVVNVTSYITMQPQEFRIRKTSETDTTFKVFLIPQDAIFKNFSIELDYLSSIDNDVNTTEKLSIYKLDEPIEGFRYHFIDEKLDHSVLLGESTFIFNPDSIKIAQDSDTITYRENIPLNETIGREIFAHLKDTSQQTFNYQSNFESLFAGIAIVPGDMNNAIFSFSPVNTTVRLEYLYENGTKTGTFVFRPFMSNNKFYNYITPNKNEPDLSNTPYSGLTCCYEGYTTNGDYIYQNFGIGANIKLDLSALKNFTDSLDNYLINTAVLEISDVVPTSGKVDAPRNIGFLITNESGMRFYETIRGYKVSSSLSAENPRLDPSRVGAPAILSFSDKDDSYRLSIGLFLQYFFENPESPEHFTLEAAFVRQIDNTYNIIDRSANTISAIKIPKESIKIKLYYSTIKQD